MSKDKIVEHHHAAAEHHEHAAKHHREAAKHQPFRVKYGGRPTRDRRSGTTAPLGRRRGIDVPCGRFHELRRRRSYAACPQVDPLRLAQEILELVRQGSRIDANRNNRVTLGRCALDLLADVWRCERMLGEHEDEDTRLIDRLYDAGGVVRSGEYVPRRDPTP